MPGWGASRSPGWQSEPAIETWRLPLRYRITLVSVQALIPLAAASLFWLPVTGTWYLPALVTWLLLAACSWTGADEAAGRIAAALACCRSRRARS